MTDPIQFNAYFFGLHVTFETAKGKRTCRGFGCNNINPGEQHLAIYSGDPHPTRDNYCLKCAKDKLKQVKEDAQAALERTSQAIISLDELYQRF
jgi:hypothetical protein